MRIKIADTEKTPFWGIPEADIHISGEDNEFREIDYSEFTPYQQQTLWSAIKMGTLETEDDEQFQKDFVSMLRGYLEQRQQDQVSQMRQVFGVDNEANKQALENVNKVEGLKEVMKGSVSTLKRVLPDYTATDLELARKIEAYGKNRKTVLKLISELISKQAKSSAAKIENPKAPSPEEFQKRQATKGEDKRFLPNISNVRESDVEEVTIKIGDG